MWNSDIINSYEGRIKWLNSKLKKCAKWRHCKIVYSYETWNMAYNE